MTTSLLSDAFAHHFWATERLIDACAALTPEQLKTPAPGAYGSIIDTLRHLVESDRWYLSFFRSEPAAPIAEAEEISLAELRSVMTSNGMAWMELLDGEIDPAADVVERGDGWEVHAPIGLRLAQVIHQRHRSSQPSLRCSHQPGPDVARDRPVELR